jgi:hypothetical protein
MTKTPSQGDLSRSMSCDSSLKGRSIIDGVRPHGTVTMTSSLAFDVEFAKRQHFRIDWLTSGASDDAQAHFDPAAAHVAANVMMELQAALTADQRPAWRSVGRSSR